MDDETIQHLSALLKVNEALIEGLKTAIFILEKEGENSRQKTAKS
jgi:hypothetical protein